MSKKAIVTVEDGDGNPYNLTDCECDNTHEQNKTVCCWCWAQGIRYEPATIPVGEGGG